VAQKAQDVKEEAVHGTQKMKEGSHSVIEKGKKMMEKGMELKEKGKELKEKGKELKEKGKEKILHMKEGVVHKVEEFEKRFEETGLGPVTGVERSVEYTTTPHRVGSEADAAIGSTNLATGPPRTSTSEVKVEPIDSVASSFSSSPRQERVTIQPEVPVSVVSDSGSVSSSERKLDAEDEAVILAPVDAVISQPVSSSSSASPSSSSSSPSSSSSSIEEGIDGPASEHAAKVQRNEGMTSNELLGTQAIKKGKEGKAKTS